MAALLALADAPEPTVRSCRTRRPRVLSSGGSAGARLGRTDSRSSRDRSVTGIARRWLPLSDVFRVSGGSVKIKGHLAR